MAKKFKDLTKDFSDERMKRVEAKTKEILRSIDLQELRKAKELTQLELAETLNISQEAVSKMESNSDMFISTLSRFIDAMGGHLRIVAEFPDREIEITQFKEIEESDFMVK
ncbi:MAG: XRE family transcriptional regulator [Candidatus Marinimicrobia bacterium]|nr:XRE family transcriptional regulator [Candidatus Neomarinimicrobiota bacterium]